MIVTARDVADRLGLKKHPRSWRGDCPACGYAQTFAVCEDRHQRTRLFCANCRNRDALEDAVRKALGGSWTAPDRPNAEDEAHARERMRAAALRLWNGSAPAHGTLAETYLRARSLPSLARSASLRFRGDCHHPEGGWLPAMVALVTDSHGRPIGVHRTYLRRDGSGKASIEPARATLGPCWGGAIRLDPVAPELVIGEGIEFSASAGLLLELPAWAAITAGNLASGLVLPPEARAVVIATDPDPAGRKAAQTAAARWRCEGRRVRIATPNTEGRDFNALICGPHDA